MAMLAFGKNEMKTTLGMYVNAFKGRQFICGIYTCVRIYIYIS